LYPHEPCSHCSSPYHSLGDCPHWGQFFNFSNEQLNTSFSSPGFESNSNFYNPDWSNYSDFSWHDHATENFDPQVDELHHPEYPQFNNHFFSHSSYDYPPEKSFLEDTLKEFMELVGQPTILASHELSLEETLEELVSLVQVVPKKSGITMVKNDDEELIPTRITIGWRVRVDFRRRF
jgi:hypothetical protein